MSILRPLVKVSGRLTPAKQNVLVTYDIVKQSFWTYLNSDLWKYRETHWRIIFAPTSSKWSFLLKIFLESESKTHIVRWIYSKFPVGLFTFTKIIVEGEFVVCEIYDLEPKKFSTLSTTKFTDEMRKVYWGWHCPSIFLSSFIPLPIEWHRR